MDKKKAFVILLAFVIVGLASQEAKAEQINFNEPNQLLDSNDNPVNYIFSDQNNKLKVKTTHGNIALDKTTCSFSALASNLNETVIFTDSIIARQAVNGTDNWQKLDQINNAACIPSWNGSVLSATKTKSGLGTLIYRYIDTGTDWKTELEVINLSNFTNRKFGFTQTMDIKKDFMKFGNNSVNLDNFNGTTFNRTWLKNHESKVLDFLNGINFDFDLAYDNLWAVSVYDTGPNSSKISFDYTRNAQIIMPNQILTYDPTLNFDSGTAAVCANAGGAVDQKRCGNYISDTAPRGYYLNSVTFRMYKVLSPTGSMVAELRTVSGDTLVATSTTSKDVSTLTTSTSGEDVTFTFSTPTIPSADFRVNTYYTGGDGSNYVYLLGTASNTVADQKFTYTFPGTTWNDVATSDIRGNLVYQTTPPSQPPNAPRDLTVSVTGKTTVDLDWTQPDLKGNTLIGYQANRTSSGLGNPQTIIINSTSATDYSVTGLTACTSYTFRVGIQGSSGYNASGNKANATTACLDPPAAPTLSATANSDIAVRFTSVNGTTGDRNITWYGLRCVENSSGPWVTIVSNSSVPNPRVYIYSGLTTADTVTCQWRDGSAAGFGPWSNNASASPILDIIEPLKGPNTDRLTRLAAWFDSMGGVYMGMPLFPFLVMMIGLLARPRTTGIFVIITLSFMGIIHGAGYYQYPDWYWALSLLFGLVVVLARFPR